VVLPIDQSTEGVTAVASFGGRVFYAGAGSALNSGDQRSPQLTGFIWFSQVIDAIEKLNKCYQDADPTSEHISDLIDTDGGFIIIKDSGVIHKLIVIRAGLLVFANNGVWFIRGGEAGFSPLANTAEKISDIGSIGASSVVPVENTVFYWSIGGIYALGNDADSGLLSAQSVSQDKIQTLYNDITEAAKAHAVGTFDSADRKIRWQYNNDPAFSGTSGRLKNNKELILDIALGAFYPSNLQVLANDSPFISNYLLLPEFTNADEVFDVVVGSDDVVVGVDDVILTTTVEQPASTRVKYFATQEVAGGNIKYTFSFYRDGDFEDWATPNGGTGIDAPAFILTGDEIAQDVMRGKAATYIVSHFERTEDGFELDGSGNIQLANQSSALLQGRWEWTNSVSAGRWTNQFQAYRLRRHFTPVDVNDPFDYGFEVVSTKSKLRGQGKAIRLRWDTEAGKDFRLLGWGITLTGKTKV